jgi:hypothetical protein
MAKALTDEQRAAISERALAAARKRGELREKPILVCGEWAVVRIDEMNMVLTPWPMDQSRYRYYGNVEQAVMAMLQQRIEDRFRKDCKGLLAAIGAAKDEIVTALKARP